MSHRIINRRRSLRPGEHTARYRRLRYAEHPDDRLIYDDQFDDWHAPYYERDDDGYDDPHQRHRDRFEQRWCALLLRLEQIGPFNPALRSRKLLGLPPAPSVHVEDDALGARPTSVSLEQRLVAHHAWLMNGSDAAPWSEPAFDLDLQHLTAVVRARLTSNPQTIVVALSMLCPFWIRSPRSWRPPAGSDRAVIFSLVEHLLCRYPVPRFLSNIWLEPSTNIEPRWLLWYVALAQGGSLRRLSDLMRRSPYGRGWGAIPKKLPAKLGSIPAHLSPKRGLIMAEVLRLGGTRTEFERLLADYSYAIDPTAYTADDPERLFWEQTVRWLARHREQLTDHESRRILGWARHRYTEEPFTLTGRSPKSAYEQARNYVRRHWSYRPRNLRWTSHRWDWRGMVGDASWSITELCDSEALYEETAAMHHCVAGYASSCARGYCAIFSVCCDGLRRVTVEVRVASKEIVQVRGVCNRLARDDERAVLRRWKAEVLDSDGTVEGDDPEGDRMEARVLH